MEESTPRNFKKVFGASLEKSSVKWREREEEGRIGGGREGGGEIMKGGERVGGGREGGGEGSSNSGESGVGGGVESEEERVVGRSEWICLVTFMEFRMEESTKVVSVNK